jgi:hypothetical protein
MSNAGGAGRGAINALIYFFIPAGATIAIALYVGAHPPTFAHPSQAAALNLTALAPLLIGGGLGVFLSVSSRMTVDPLRRGFARAAMLSLVSGAIFGAAALATDYFSGFSGLIAGQLGIRSIHIAFPASAYVYAAGAIAVECLYRLIPVSILYAVVARLILRGRGEAAVFWTLAFLSSLIEPLSQAPLAGAEPNLVWLLFGFIFAFNLSEAALWRRYGWPAPILSRLAFYAVWHVVFGPMLSGTI